MGAGLDEVKTCARRNTSVLTAVSSGDASQRRPRGDSNAGESFCILFGSHEPFDDAQLAVLYRSHGSDVSDVARVDTANAEAGYLVPADAELNIQEAAESDIGKRPRYTSR